MEDTGTLYLLDHFEAAIAAHIGELLKSQKSHVMSKLMSLISYSTSSACGNVTPFPGITGQKGFASKRLYHDEFLATTRYCDMRAGDDQEPSRREKTPKRSIGRTKLIYN
jgi:hypothetical protein